MADTAGVKYASNQAGADLGAQIQAAIDAVESTGGWVIVDAFGGTLTSAIVVKSGVTTFWYPGIFTTANTITVYEGAGIIGSGTLNMGAGGTEPGTQFVLANGVNADVIFCHDKAWQAWQAGTLRNFSINGNSANQSAGSGVRIARFDISDTLDQVAVQYCKQAGFEFDGPQSTDSMIGGIYAGHCQYGLWLTPEHATNSTAYSGTLHITSFGANANSDAAILYVPGARSGLHIGHLRLENNAGQGINVDLAAGSQPLISIESGEVAVASGTALVKVTGAASAAPFVQINNFLDINSTLTNVYEDATTAANTITWASVAPNNRLMHFERGLYGSTIASYQAFSPYSVTLANGANNNILLGPSGAAPFITIAGPTGAFSISGFLGNAAAGNGNVAGRRLTVYNPISQVMTITNDATSTAANRILTLTGSDVVLTSGPSVLEFIYSSADSRWLLASSRP